MYYVITVHRSLSTATMNGVSNTIINNNSMSVCTSLNTLVVPTQGRRNQLTAGTPKSRTLKLPILKRKCKIEKNTKGGKGTETVKLWLIKGMVQVMQRDI